MYVRYLFNAHYTCYIQHHQRLLTLKYYRQEKGHTIITSRLQNDWYLMTKSFFFFKVLHSKGNSKRKSQTTPNERHFRICQ